jgi:endonuclease-3
MAERRRGGAGGRAPRATAARRRSTAPAPVVTAADRREAIAIADRLDRQHPDATTELNYHTPFELLVATILSAQCTDERVNQVTPPLFARYPDAGALARAHRETLEREIQPTGFFRMKARALLGMSQALVDHHEGEVPASMDALVDLPGVGRKTANVVLGHALGVPGFPVDRHVLRVTGRLGISRSPDPELVEAAWCARIPPARWTRLSDALILHGRRICRPKPRCDRCQLRRHCAYYRALGPGAGPAAAPPRRQGRR